jgi:hypothetical protein
MTKKDKIVKEFHNLKEEENTILNRAERLKSDYKSMKDFTNLIFQKFIFVMFLFASVIHINFSSETEVFLLNNVPPMVLSSLLILFFLLTLDSKISLSNLLKKNSKKEKRKQTLKIFGFLALLAAIPLVGVFFHTILFLMVFLFPIFILSIVVIEFFDYMLKKKTIKISFKEFMRNSPTVSSFSLYNYEEITTDKIRLREIKKRKQCILNEIKENDDLLKEFKNLNLESKSKEIFLRNELLKEFEKDYSEMLLDYHMEKNKEYKIIQD